MKNASVVVAIDSENGEILSATLASDFKSVDAECPEGFAILKGHKFDVTNIDLVSEDEAKAFVKKHRTWRENIQVNLKNGPRAITARGWFLRLTKYDHLWFRSLEGQEQVVKAVNEVRVAYGDKEADTLQSWFETCKEEPLSEEELEKIYGVKFEKH